MNALHDAIRAADLTRRSHVTGDPVRARAEQAFASLTAGMSRGEIEVVLHRHPGAAGSSQPTTQPPSRRADATSALLEAFHCAADVDDVNGARRALASLRILNPSAVTPRLEQRLTAAEKRKAQTAKVIGRVVGEAITKAERAEAAATAKARANRDVAVKSLQAVLEDRDGECVMHDKGLVRQSLADPYTRQHDKERARDGLRALGVDSHATATVRSIAEDRRRMNDPSHFLPQEQQDALDRVMRGR